MSNIFKQTTAIILTAFIAYVMYVGSLLPLQKSQAYIRARQTKVTTLDQFDKLYNGVLEYSSPVGQDEIVSNYLDMLSNIIGQEKNKEKPNETLIRHLVGEAEKWTDPIIERGAGFSFSQIIFNFASVYRDATMALKDENYYKKAVELYNLGLQYSPDRQIFLYSLFDMYRFRGDAENAKRIGERILKVYKDDRVQQILGTI